MGRIRPEWKPSTQSPARMVEVFHELKHTVITVDGQQPSHG